MASSASLIPLQAMGRSGTSSTTRFGAPFEERDFIDRTDQESFATDTSFVSRIHGDRRGPSLSEQWEYEHRDSHLPEQHNDEHTNTAAVDQLLHSEPTLHSGGHNGMGTPKDQGVDGSRSNVVVSTPTHCRKINALSTMGQAALDLCITATSVYFIVFATMAVQHAGEPEGTRIVQILLRAARFVSLSNLPQCPTALIVAFKGPTVWPIVFSAIVGRFLTAFTAWRLERGVEVAAVEYIIGSRTVFGVISTPFRLRLLHYILPILLVLWALSPLGGQASLRVVSLHGSNTTRAVDVFYLDSLTPNESDTISIFGDLMKAVFISALVAPLATKTAYQDLFGNLKVPLLEDFDATSRFRDEDGWYSTESEHALPYSSLIGLSTAGIPADGRTLLNIETSYLYFDCLLTRQDYDFDKSNPDKYPILHQNFTWDRWGDGNCNNGDGNGMALALGVDPERNASDPSTGPRKILFGSRGDEAASTAECSVTTTYTEVSYGCNGKACLPVAIRRSRVPQGPTTTTWFDAGSGNTPTWEAAFCSGFINATELGTINPYHSSVLTRFLMDPDNPFADPGVRPTFANLTNDVFSRRFTQLLNTYLLAHTSPVSVSGDFTGLLSGAGEGNGYISNTTAEQQTTENVLGYDPRWLVVLIASSFVMLAAGIATVILNLMRRGPEILDSFTSMLRENPYVHEEIGLSTEDASEKVRRLRKTRVMLGDVRPLEATGYVAVTTRTGGDGVQPLRSRRLYY
jgi:hypothetical protein